MPFISHKDHLGHNTTNISHWDRGISEIGYGSCQPLSKVVFMKTHKTGSTTIQNILMRKAVKYHLNIVETLYGPFSPLRHSKPFQPSMIENTPWDMAGLQYDMFLDHVTWVANQKKKNCLTSFNLKNRLIFRFDSKICLNYLF